MTSFMLVTIIVLYLVLILLAAVATSFTVDRASQEKQSPGSRNGMPTKHMQESALYVEDRLIARMSHNYDDRLRTMQCSSSA